jgi:predicted nucleotidyltransferase
LGLFGSHDKENATPLSDIDIAYKLDYEKFPKNYEDGFAKLLRIDAIKKELQNIFKKFVDLVPNKNTAIMQEIAYV